MSLPVGYTAVHRYDGAVIERGGRDKLVPCAVQPRDVAIIRDVWRYRFLTTDQLLELWWSHASAQAARRRLVKLFRAGYLDRFRPLSRRGSYPWTYQLGREGHRLLQETGAIGRRERFSPRTIYDFGYVVHDLQLNAWALAWRRSLGAALVEWSGELEVQPPRDLRPIAPILVDGDWSAEALRDARPRLLRPDAMLEVEHDGLLLTYLVEFDRTRRIDKNYEKFRRYDSFLNWWWRHSRFGDLAQPPTVIFICQDEDHVRQFLTAADRELTGHLAHPSVRREPHHYEGRQLIVFTIESDMHAGMAGAWRVPNFPRSPYHDDEDRSVRCMPLPGYRGASTASNAA